MNDLRLLQQIDPNKKVISLEFKYMSWNIGKLHHCNQWCPCWSNSKTCNLFHCTGIGWKACLRTWVSWKALLSWTFRTICSSTSMSWRKAWKLYRHWPTWSWTSRATRRRTSSGTRCRTWRGWTGSRWCPTRASSPSPRGKRMKFRGSIKLISKASEFSMMKSGKSTGAKNTSSTRNLLTTSIAMSRTSCQNSHIGLKATKVKCKRIVASFVESMLSLIYAL